MDRGKSGQSSRGGAKSKITQYPPDIFALGSKPSSSRDDSKRPTSSHAKSSSSSHSSSSKVSTDRKREGGLTPVPPTKKPKVAGVIRAVGSASSSSSGSSSAASTSQQVSLEHWETIAIDAEPNDVVLRVIKELEAGDTERAAAYVCGAIKLLKVQRYKPEKVLYLGLLYIAKYRSNLFVNESVVAALASLLRRDTAHSFKSKGNPAVPVLCANLLLKGHLNVPNWPELFVKLYMEDALGDRIWVDHEECRPFVENIVTAFNTRIPPKALLTPELSGALTGTRDTSSPITVDDEAREGRNTPELLSISAHDKEGNADVPILPRYSQSHEVVEQIVLEAIKEQLNRRQPLETITRNFLRLLSSACGLVEIRIIAVSRLEMWLHNPKLMRPAQELLAYLCCNCVNVTQRDLEVTAYLTKIRLKTKALVNVYLNCLRELLTSHSENLPSMLKHTIYNELSNARNPNNMPMIAVMFQAAPETAANVLAEIFQDLLLNKDDYLRSLRALLREIVRVLRFDINLYALCRSLVKERKELTVALRDFEFKDRMFASVADLLCLAMFLGISPQVKEAAGLLARGDKKEIATLQSYQMLAAKIQKEAVTWLHEGALRIFRPSPPDFMHVLHKVLFLEPAEQYYKVDLWPSESDRNLLLRLASEIPLLQATLIRILLIGISKDHPLNPPDTMELADKLIKRAAGLPVDGFACLQADKLEIIDLIFNLTAYHYPDNINLPQGYTPPQLAITNLYWKGWIMLLMLAAHNPTTFGNQAWKKYPMLRTFMEMCITNHFAYPPPTVAMGEMYEEMKNKELQIAAMDKQQILEFESHLAAASTKMTITEQSSLLLSQLIEMCPMGDPRQPPQQVLDQLAALNGTHRMGHLLCRSRNPDFLLEIIQRQGSSQHMPWLADLVHNSEGALSHLPVQCLCEYLLISGMQEKNEKHRKHSQVLAHLQQVLTDPTQDYTASYEILEYFLRRLNSLHCASRVQAVKGLKMVLSTVIVEDVDVDMETDSNVDYWLLRQVRNLPHFAQHIRPLMVASLRQACQVETDPEHVSSYINFLAQQTVNDSLSDMLDLVLDMAQLIVERSTIIAAVLPVTDHENKTAYQTLHSLMTMFCSYLSKAKEPRHETITWSESQDHVLITWANGEECTMHILVVHAMIILLTYGLTADDRDLFNTLLETWFPLNGEQPKAYLVDTSEEALLIPDWLKLRMIRSTVPRLVDAALVNLEPSQLVLFIQSFGIPVSSMSKLLCNLDAAVTVNQNSVDEAVLDKCYMAQLVEVQHRRGATGGNVFVQVLQLLEPKLPDEQEIEIENSKTVFPQKILTNVVTDRNGWHLMTIINVLNCVFSSVKLETNIERTYSKILRDIGCEIDKTNKESVKSLLISHLVQYLARNVNTQEFVNEFVRKEQYSCPLLRLILTSRAGADEIVGLAKNVLLRIEKNGTLYEMLKSYLKNQSLAKREKRAVVTGDPEQVLKNTDLVSLERATKQLVDQNLEETNNRTLVEAMSKLLLSDVEAKQFERTGLLVDWLAELEMEIISSNPELQLRLLFARHPSSNVENWMVFRPYLLTLLTHRASWSTLHACVAHLLSDCSLSYDPTAVLDFLSALTCNPKLWQGRDKFTPKNYRQEDVLRLRNEQIKTLVDYVLEEAYYSYNSTKTSSSNVVLKMESRLKLLIQCLEERNKTILYVVRHLQECAKEPDIEPMEVITIDDVLPEAVNRNKSVIAQEFLVLFYMKLPKIIYLLDAKEKKNLCKLSYISDDSTSIVDNISHNLFTALAATPRTKDWSKRSQEFDLLARKLAAVHPALILRQLPMIATGLKGRTHLDFSVFKSRNHLNLFGQILGVVELLIPDVFEEAHKEGLEGILRSYFSLFKNHGHVKELHTYYILGRFVSLLQSFMSYNPTRALTYIQQYAHLLYDLHLTYSNLRPLRSLMSSISLPKEEGLSESNGDVGEVLVAVARPPSPEPVPPNWNNLVSSIGKLQDEEMTSVLQEIDHISNRRSAILEPIIDQIAPLTLSQCSSVRQLAHVLLVRYLKHNPVSITMSSPILSSVIRCLESSNPEIVNCCLEKLAEHVVCLQEHADVILEKAFLLGVKSNISISSNIVKAINVLNIQSGA